MTLNGIIMRLFILISFFTVYTALGQGISQGHKKLEIDAGFRGGNIVVNKIVGDTVYVHQNLHDTEGNWFYWAFRVRGAENRTLIFKFIDLEKYNVFTSLGPAVSVDEGNTWNWGKGKTLSSHSFSYTFSSSVKEARFSMGMPYTETHLNQFLEKHLQNPSLEKSVIAQSREGREIERLQLGKLHGKARFKIVLTARHHACEMMGSYVLEGMMEEFLANTSTGNWIKENAEVLVIPFVDKDGVENGDQGKNRRGRDHNRDYSGEGIYETTRWLRAFVPAWAAGSSLIGLDIHCPFISGGTNEQIHIVGSKNAGIATEESKFSKKLEKQAALSNGLGYKETYNIPFGTSWNIDRNFQKGASFREWIGGIPEIKLGTTLEFPYSNASGMEITQENTRQFGRTTAKAMVEYLMNE
jgi:hypothetical protein